MAFKDLREFLAVLEKHGEVQKVKKEVDWNLEAGAITRRIYERGLPAAFFEKLRDYSPEYRLLGGPLGSHRRVSLALGVAPDTHLRDLMEIYLERKKKAVKPVLVKSGPCKENVHTGNDVNVLEFPVPMLHEGDGGRYIATWHAMITKDPDTGWANWGMYRAMVLSRNRIAFLAEPNQHGGFHYYRQHEPRGIDMPIAFAIGMEPVCSMMAAIKVPYQVNEVDVAGGLRGEPVEMVKCETVDLEVPASSEIVLEGYVRPQERAWEGPFGEYTGYRASPRYPRPVMRVTAVTHRNQPILTASCMGVPIDDSDATMSVGEGAEILSELRAKGIQVADLCLSPDSAHLTCIVSVKVPYANIAQRVADIVWATEAGQNLPYVVVVEDDVDPHNLPQVFHAMSSKCHPHRGYHSNPNAVGHQLLPFLSRPERIHRQGAHAYFDCTWPTDWDPSIAVPTRASFDKIYPREVQEFILKNWHEYGYKKL